MWYYVKDNRQIGPVDANEIRSLIAQGTIQRDTLLWTGGMDRWTEAEKTEFSEDFTIDLIHAISPENYTRSTEPFWMKEAVVFGWNTMKDNLGFFILLLIIYAVLVSVPDRIAAAVTAVNVYAGVVLHIADYLFSWLMGLGMIKIALNFCDHKPGRISDLFSQYRLLWKYVAASVLFGLITSGGYLLLIIPGIVWALKYFFYTHLIVDENPGIIASLKRSASITQGAKGKLFCFSFLLMLINIAGFLCFFVGLFATIPTTMVALAHVYRQLHLRHQQAAASL